MLIQFVKNISVLNNKSTMEAFSPMISDLVVCALCSDPDGWKGVFTRGHEQSLIWKEGEVYLLPYREENGFYKAPGRTTNIQYFLEHVGVGLL